MPVLNSVSCFRSDHQSRWLWSLGSQQGPDPGLCQLAHPGRAELADLQRVQDPPRLLDAGVQLGPGPPVLHHQGPRRLWRPLWSSRAPAEFRQGLGRLLRPPVCRVLPLLAGDHAHAPEMRKSDEKNNISRERETLLSVWSILLVTPIKVPAKIGLKIKILKMW